MSNNKLVTIILAAMISLVLTACGAASADVPSLNTIEDTRVAEPTADAASEVRDNEALMMAFAECLRDQGLDVMDPVVDADGNVGRPELAPGTEWDDEMKAVQGTCEHHLEGFTWEKERVDMSELVDQLLALSTCLRDKDYDVDDPTAETIDQWKDSLRDAIDFKDPAAKADYEECNRDAGMMEGDRK